MLYDKLRHELADRSLFQKAKDHALEYLESSNISEVFPTEESLQNLNLFDEAMPEEGIGAHEILDLLYKNGSPNTTRLNGGRYFGFVNGGITPAALASKWLADAWDQNAGMNVMSPICGKLEKVVEGWLCELFGFDENTAAGFVTGSSAATYCGLIAARFHLYHKMGYNINLKGMCAAPIIRIVTSIETHSSVKRALAMLGFGYENIEFVESDEQGRLKADQLPTLDKKTIVILQAGNVNSGSFDPFNKVCDLANAAGAWVHIDGAFGLWAGATEKFGHLTQGFQKADSWCVDGHKTLNTPYDCGIVMCKHRQSMLASLHASGEYLIGSVGEGRDGMFYTPDMSRRARIIDLWSTLKSLGKSGIEELVGTLHDRAKQFATEIQEHGFEVLNDCVFNQVVLAFKDDEMTDQILQYVQNQRICWCGGSVWKERRVIRISVCAWSTTTEDISKSVESFKLAKEATLLNLV